MQFLLEQKVSAHRAHDVIATLNQLLYTLIVLINEHVWIRLVIICKTPVLQDTNLYESPSLPLIRIVRTMVRGDSERYGRVRENFWHGLKFDRSPEPLPSAWNFYGALVRIVLVRYILIRSISDQKKSTHGPQCMYGIRAVWITLMHEPYQPNCDPNHMYQHILY